MTPESTRPHTRAHTAQASRSQLDMADEMDLMAGLWQEAPFPRLPPDAPLELDEYLQEVDNPRRVYAIHRASRRHDFQLLVDMYDISPECRASY